MKSLICTLVTLLVVGLTVYAPIELTRVIVTTSSAHSESWREFIFEIVFMWAFYTAGMTLVMRRIR